MNVVQIDSRKIEKQYKKYYCFKVMTPSVTDRQVVQNNDPTSKPRLLLVTNR